jgi:hypothetical protein
VGWKERDRDVFVCHGIFPTLAILTIWSRSSNARI